MAQQETLPPARRDRIEMPRGNRVPAPASPQRLLARSARGSRRRSEILALPQFEDQEHLQQVAVIGAAGTRLVEQPLNTSSIQHATVE